VAVREILVIGDERLRQKAKKITRFDESLKTLIDDMLETMHEANGLGLAATQIGVPLRLVVIEMPEEKDEDGTITRPKKTYILCNPEIVKRSGEEVMEEGCLSIPGYAGRVLRATDVLVKARNAQGREVRYRGDGLLAQAFQHELDHLDGVLYVDRVQNPADFWRLAREEQEEEIEEEQEI